MPFSVPSTEQGHYSAKGERYLFIVLRRAQKSDYSAEEINARFRIPVKENKLEAERLSEFLKQDAEVQRFGRKS